MTMKTLSRAGWRGILFAALALGAAGCQSFKTSTSSAPIASVTVSNKPLPEICQIARNVMVSHGFTVAETPPNPNQLVFKRPGSRSNTLAFGSYVFDEAVTIRV